MGRGSHAQRLSSHLPLPLVPPWLMMEAELFMNHRCYPANQPGQFSSDGTKQTSTSSEGMAYSSHMDCRAKTFTLMHRFLHKIPSDPLGCCRVLVQGPFLWTLKRSQILASIWSPILQKANTSKGCRQLRKPLHHTLPEPISSDNIPVWCCIAGVPELPLLMVTTRESGVR